MTTEAGTETTTSGNPNPGDPSGGDEATQQQSQPSGDKVQPQLVATPFGELDTDTADWLSKREVKDPPSLIKLARDKDSMVGRQAAELAKAIVPPGKDAKPEEIKAFREKMGIPLDPEGYDFKAPEKLPEGLPYDGERANAFKAKAHELGLSKAQADKLHSWFTETAVEDFNGAAAANETKQVETAKGETAKLVKLYGPVTGEQFKTQAAFADKALSLGGEDVVADFKRAGMIGDAEGTKIVQSAATFNWLAKIGQTLFTEGEVVKGDPTRLDNPFADGPTHNVTRQMQLWKTDQKHAEAMIRAAGKTPADLGFKT